MTQEEETVTEMLSAPEPGRVLEPFEKTLARILSLHTTNYCPVIYLHKGPEEDLVGCVVEAEFLSRLWTFASTHGFKDKKSSPEAQKDNFLVHNHFVIGEN